MFITSVHTERALKELLRCEAEAAEAFSLSRLLREAGTAFPVNVPSLLTGPSPSPALGAGGRMTQLKLLFVLARWSAGFAAAALMTAASLNIGQTRVWIRAGIFPESSAAPVSVHSVLRRFRVQWNVTAHIL